MITYVSAGLLALLAVSIPVGIVLFLLGFGVDQFFSNFPLSRALGNMVWSSHSIFRPPRRNARPLRRCNPHLCST